MREVLYKSTEIYLGIVLNIGLSGTANKSMLDRLRKVHRLWINAYRLTSCTLDCPRHITEYN
jgi:hypothetical protein